MSKTTPNPSKNSPVNSKVFTTTRPRDKDILCGRGVYHHPGNKAYLKLVESQRSLYQSRKSAYKQCITKSVMKTIQSKGVRFLQQSNDTDSLYWFEIDRKQALKKISQALREKRSERKKKGRKRTATAKRMLKMGQTPKPTPKLPTTKGSRRSPRLAVNPSESQANPNSKIQTFASNVPNPQDMTSHSNSRMVRSKTYPTNLCFLFNEHGSGSIEATNGQVGLDTVLDAPFVGWNNLVPDSNYDWKLFDFSNDETETRPNDSTAPPFVHRSLSSNPQLDVPSNNMEWMPYYSSRRIGL